MSLRLHIALTFLQFHLQLCTLLSFKLSSSILIDGKKKGACVWEGGGRRGAGKKESERVEKERQGGIGEDRGRERDCRGERDTGTHTLQR